MRKSIINIVSASALTLSISAAAFACGGQGKVLKSLDLTDSQQEQVHELFEHKRDDKKIIKEKHKAIKQKKSMLATNYSDALANEIADEAASLAKERTLSRIQHQQSVLAILTDDQKEKYIELMETKHKQDRKGHGKFH